MGAYVNVAADLPAVTTPWGETGYLVYKRTYARRIVEDDPNSETEEFPDTIARVIKASRTQLKVGFTVEEEQQLAQDLLGLKGSVAGRFLWQMGTKTVQKFGLASMQNCAFVSVDQPVRPFTWAMDMLMLGCGVGFNIQRVNVDKLPPVTKKRPKIVRVDNAGADYIVPDTREGWVKLLGKVMKAYMISGKGFTYSTQLIRGRGAVIKSFGGTASGAEILVDGLQHIMEVLDNRRGQKLRPIDCLDVMDIIGMIVVAGNVRRSALIALGDCDDIEYLEAKTWTNPDGTPRDIPNWRSNSNNSVVCDDFSKIPVEFWNGYKGNGEPYGLINLKNARRMGRLDDLRYPDLNIMGFNPCAEQGLEDFETCCLAELFLPNCNSYEELRRTAFALYRICKHSLRLPCHNEETEEVVHRNMRMGIGITGYEGATEVQKRWLPALYEELRQYDVDYSAAHGWPISIKLTTVKPSGTLSLLAGCPSGGHAGFSKYYWRRVRIASESPLIDICKANGFPVEYLRNLDGTDDHKTQVVSFPCKFEDHVTLVCQKSAVDQLNTVKRLQTDWSDNAVSVTIYYRLEELDEIKEWLAKNYTDNVKTVSFLLHSDHGFDQAPLEEMTEEEFIVAHANVTPIRSISFKETDMEEDAACAGGICPIK